MQGLFRSLGELLSEKTSCVLAIVAASEGSTPRGPGAMMLVTAAGRHWGSIGGGIIEYQAIERAKELLDCGQTEVMHFDITVRSNAMCGGAYDVLLYYLDFCDAAVCRAMKQILEQSSSGRFMQVLFPLAGGLPVLCLEHQTSIINRDGYFCQSFNRDGAVYIFGGGHVAQQLAPVLQQLDFRCVVLDDREEFANRTVFPTAAQVMQVDYEKLEKNIQLKGNDYVVIMTRGHQYDLEVERFALRSEAKYIGLMGSRTKKGLLRSLLLAEGFTEQQLDRVIIPIGLDISSETPAEIAISIAAQLIQVRAKIGAGSERYRE